MTATGTVDVLAAARRLFAAQGYRGTTMADVGAAVGLRGPSLYRHVRSKQELLVAIMVDTMETLLREQSSAVAAGGGPELVLRRAVEAHVRFHAANRENAFVGNRELDSLEPVNRERVLTLRRRYERRLRAVVADGVAAGVFHVSSPRLASYAVLEMGIGVATWFRPDGPHSVDEVVYTYSGFALALVGVHP